MNGRKRWCTCQELQMMEWKKINQGKSYYREGLSHLWDHLCCLWEVRVQITPDYKVAMESTCFSLHASHMAQEGSRRMIGMVCVCGSLNLKEICVLDGLATQWPSPAGSSEQLQAAQTLWTEAKRPGTSPASPSSPVLLLGDLGLHPGA